jgi:hypothetical protein
MLISFEFEFSLYRCELCEALFKYDILQILSTLKQRPFVLCSKYLYRSKTYLNNYCGLYYVP